MLFVRTNREQPVTDVMSEVTEGSVVSGHTRRNARPPPRTCSSSDVGSTGLGEIFVAIARSGAPTLVSRSGPASQAAESSVAESAPGSVSILSGGSESDDASCSEAEADAADAGEAPDFFGFALRVARRQSRGKDL